MIYKIVDKIAEGLEDLVFADKVGGIAKKIITNIGGTQKTFPVYFNINQETCKTENYVDLVPDSSLKSIFYFEIIGQPSVVAANKRFIDFTSTVRLIGWVNYKLINQGFYDPSLIVANIIKEIPERLDKIDFMSAIHITFSASVSKDDLFTGLSYNEPESQFMTYPYDAFGLDYDIDYRISTGCVSDVVINTAPCCDELKGIQIGDWTVGSDCEVIL